MRDFLISISIVAGLVAALLIPTSMPIHMARASQCSYSASAGIIRGESRGSSTTSGSCSFSTGASASDVEVSPQSAFSNGQATSGHSVCTSQSLANINDRTTTVDSSSGSSSSGGVSCATHSP